MSDEMTPLVQALADLDKSAEDSDATSAAMLLRSVPVTDRLPALAAVALERRLIVPSTESRSRKRAVSLGAPRIDTTRTRERRY